MNRLRDHRGRFIKTPKIQCKSWHTSWIFNALPNELENLVLQFATHPQTQRIVNRKHAHASTTEQMIALRRSYAEAFFLQPTHRNLQYLFRARLKSRTTTREQMALRAHERRVIRQFAAASRALYEENAAPPHEVAEENAAPQHEVTQPIVRIAPASFSVTSA